MTSGDAFVIRRPFIEDGAQSLAIESETESVFLCKSRDFCFPIFLVHRPQPFQVLLVNRAVLPLAMHPAFDLSRERFHRFNIEFILRLQRRCLSHKIADSLAFCDFSSLRTHFRAAYCMRLLCVNMAYVKSKVYSGWFLAYKSSCFQPT